MNKEKQKIISDICPFYKEYGTCEQCNTALDTDDEPCYYEYIANAIINNGYRKQSEVAREIFEEIVKIMKPQERYLYCNPSLTYVYEMIEEIKKKYLGG